MSVTVEAAMPDETIAHETIAHDDRSRARAEVIDRLETIAHETVVTPAASTPPVHSALPVAQAQTVNDPHQDSPIGHGGLQTAIRQLAKQRFGDQVNVDRAARLLFAPSTLQPAPPSDAP